MEKTRDPQTRGESKTRLIEQIKIYLQASDYSRALDLLRGTAAEFPNDAELSELEKLAQKGLQRRADADRLITESQELFSQQKYGKALQLLREAYELDKTNSLARSILANALVEHAYSIVETNWWEAETLANEALALNPAHPTAKTIHSRILEQKTKGSVEEWVSQTRKLQSSGNLSAALSQIAEGFIVYPRDPRLLQLHDAIQRDHSVQRRQARRRDLEELRRMESEIEAVADAASKKVFSHRIQAFVAKYSTDGEFLTVANRLQQRLGSLEVAHNISASKPESEENGITDHAPASAVDSAMSAASSKPSSGLDGNRLATTIPVLAKNAPPIPIPSGNVLPGSVNAAAVAPGRVPLSEAPASKISLTLVAGNFVTTPPEPHPPVPQAVTAAAPEHSAQPAKGVSLPSKLKSQASSNSTILILICAAAIILIAAILFFVRNHQAAPLAKGPTPNTTISAPVSTPTVLAPAASVPATSAPVPAATVPAPAATTFEPSLPSTSLESNRRIDSKHKTEPSHDIVSGHNVSDHNTGALLVVAGQDGASVFLNGKLQPQITQAGQLLLPNLDGKDYVVRVSKNGFQDAPQQTIRIRNGEQAKLVFNLQPLPHFASLTIQGGVPGTRVLIDQTSVGAIQQDGTLSASNLNPGDHSIELRKEGFKPRQFAKHFVAGAAISLIAADAALEAAPSQLKITFTPAEAKVAIVKAGELPVMVNSGVSLNVAAGTYTLTARTADRFARSSTFEITAGQSKTLDLSLAPSGMSKWDNPAAWKHETDSFICKGGDYVLYGVTPVSGTFAFSAMASKGRVVQWVLNYTDSKNYVLFQIDDNAFYRSLIRNGEKTNEIIVPDKGDKKTFRTLHIRVSPTEIVHQIKHGDSWTVLDRWTLPGVDLSQGKFGFYIPRSDEVALSSFAFYPDLDLR